MKIKILTDGTMFTGNTPEELIQNMNQYQFTPCNSIQEYMEEVKKRVQSIYGKHILTDSVDDFIRSLENIKFIEVIEK